MFWESLQCLEAELFVQAGLGSGPAIATRTYTEAFAITQSHPITDHTPESNFKTFVFTPVYPRPCFRVCYTQYKVSYLPYFDKLGLFYNPLDKFLSQEFRLV